MKNTNPPTALNPEGRRLYRKLAREYGIGDAAGLIILKTACEAFDRMKSCQSAIARDGETVRDRWNQLKPHPLLAAERDARAQFLAGLRALNLDVEPVLPVGRPGGR